MLFTVKAGQGGITFPLDFPNPLILNDFWGPSKKLNVIRYLANLLISLIKSEGPQKSNEINGLAGPGFGGADFST
jgi:hypothetical protein